MNQIGELVIISKSNLVRTGALRVLVHLYTYASLPHEIDFSRYEKILYSDYRWKSENPRIFAYLGKYVTSSYVSSDDQSSKPSWPKFTHKISLKVKGKKPIDLGAKEPVTKRTSMSSLVEQVLSIPIVRPSSSQPVAHTFSMTTLQASDLETLALILEDTPNLIVTSLEKRITTIPTSNMLANKEKPCVEWRLKSFPASKLAQPKPCLT